MPFDETPHRDEGGGGHGGPHDVERMAAAGDTALQTMEMICAVDSLCIFHTGLTMQAMMFQACADHAEDVKSNINLDQQIDLVERWLERLKERRDANV